MSPDPKIRPPQRAGVPETGRLIRQARERAGLSLAGLGDLAGFGAATIGNWERADREVGVSQLLRLARALNTHPASLLPAPVPFSLRGRDRAREALRLLSLPAEGLTEAGLVVTRELAARELVKALRGSGGSACGLLCAECERCDCPCLRQCTTMCHSDAGSNDPREREKAAA